MQALILAGGTGTRFWPSSRRARAKQFLALDQERTMLQATVDRVRDLVAPDAIWVCTTGAQAATVAEQVPEVSQTQILAEPEGRNTAPAIGWSVLSMPVARRDDVVVVLPADHRVEDVASFRETLSAAAEVVTSEDRVMTLGVTPRWAETGYGYLELGEVLNADTGLRRVVRFTEKPDQETADRFVASGNYYWNPGIFLFRGNRMLELLRRYEPGIAAGLEEIGAHPERRNDLYPRLPAVSIDYGVMERHDGLATLPLDCGWSDLGSWAALAEVLSHDERGNATRGDVVAIEADDNLLFAERGTIAALEVRGLVVVRTEDAVLVVPRDRAQSVRKVVAALEAAGRDDLL